MIYQKMMNFWTFPLRRGLAEDRWGVGCVLTSTRFPSSPLIVRVPVVLLCGLIREPKKKKGKRVLLENLVQEGVASASCMLFQAQDHQNPKPATRACLGSCQGA